jgi:hypothetical protein
MSSTEPTTVAPIPPTPAPTPKPQEPEEREITIYEFEVHDPIEDSMKKSRRWGTSEAIKNTTHGRIIGEGAVVDRSVVESPQTDIDGLTAQDFDPKTAVPTPVFDPTAVEENDDLADPGLI